MLRLEIKHRIPKVRAYSFPIPCQCGGYCLR